MSGILTVGNSGILRVEQGVITTAGAPAMPTVWDGTYDGTGNGPISVFDLANRVQNQHVFQTTTNNVFAVLTGARLKF